MVKSLIKLFLRPFKGKKRYQGFFEFLLNQIHSCMNIGFGGGTKNTGEEKVLELISKSYPKDKSLVCLDVGANIGMYSLLIQNTFSQRPFIYAFEPSKSTFETLSENTKDVESIKRFNFGLGKEEHTLTLYSDSRFSGISSVYNRDLDHTKFKYDNHEEIEIRTLDGFCTEKNIEHIHLLKLDVEGHEISVLEGGAWMLKENKVDFIQFEFGGCNIDSRTYLKDFFLLLQERYFLFRIVNDGIHKLRQYSELHEVFNTTNFLAINKSKNLVNEV